MGLREKFKDVGKNKIIKRKISRNVKSIFESVSESVQSSINKKPYASKIKDRKTKQIFDIGGN